MPRVPLVCCIPTCIPARLPGSPSGSALEPWGHPRCRLLGQRRALFQNLTGVLLPCLMMRGLPLASSGTGFFPPVLPLLMLPCYYNLRLSSPVTGGLSIFFSAAHLAISFCELSVHMFGPFSFGLFAFSSQALFCWGCSVLFCFVFLFFFS